MGFFDFLKPKFLVRRSLSSVAEQKVILEWQGIEALKSVGKPSALKEAVIKADKLLDFALSQVVSGETLGQRLKEAKDLFRPTVYDKVWKAHKVRNAMAHELNYDPPYFITKEALDNFKDGFRDLGVRF